MNNVNEAAIRAGDLIDMVLPILSIDEYDTKLGKENAAIVVAFFLKSQEAAKDLRGFIERGAIRFIDCEVSPSPDKSMHWLVFIEYKRNKQFWDKFLLTVNEVERLIGHKVKWECKTYFSNKHFDINDPELKLSVELDPVEYLIRRYWHKKKIKNKKLNEFFKYSDIKNIKLLEDGGLHFFKGLSDVYLYPEKLCKLSELKEGTFMEALSFDRDCMHPLMRDILGSEYRIHASESFVFITNDDNIMVLRKCQNKIV